MGAVTVKVDANGALRGSTAPFRLAALRRLQRKLADAKPAGDDRSAIDDLIADRRAEAAREESAKQAWEEARRRGQAAE